MFFRTSSDTLRVSDEPEELIRDGFTWPHAFVLKNKMLRNRVIYVTVELRQKTTLDKGRQNRYFGICLWLVYEVYTVSSFIFIFNLSIDYDHMFPFNLILYIFLF